jgi:S-adenosylmethionine-diacylglycerol 3-amino-3-carboxypropyl transferase
MTAALPNEIAPVLRASGVRYSHVWEDARMALHALWPTPRDDVLSIASAGCNALALLLRAPRSVIAVDVNPAQTALLDLKIAGIRRLEHAAFAELLGARPSVRRATLYDRVRAALPASSRDFWDSRVDEIERGVMRGGRLDRYLFGFAPFHHAGARGRSIAEGLLACADVAEQREYFAEHFDRPAFRDAFQEYFGRVSMARDGRDPAQFRYVPDEFDVGRYFWERFRDVCTRLPVADNHYLELFLTGRYRRLDCGPAYLRPASFARLKTLVDRLTTVTATVEDVVADARAGRFSVANLSDLFEYLSPESSDALFELLATRLRCGGRLCYWNLLVPRSAPARLRRRLVPDRALAHRLWLRDRAWFYSDFHVEEIARP